VKAGDTKADVEVGQRAEWVPRMIEHEAWVLAPVRA
jgi:hypothetical protein